MSDFSNDERFDGLYINVAQTTRGIEPLLDTVFSFLRRKTDFFHGPRGEDTDAAVAKVNEVLNKHVKMYKQQRAVEEERKEKQAKAKREKKEKADRLKAEKKAKEEEAKRKAEEEVKTKAKPHPQASSDASEDVIELSDDGGFDISNSTGDKADDSQSKTKSNDTDEDVDMKSEPAASTPESNKNTDADEGESKTPPPLGNGGTVPDKYIWTQTLAELNLTIALPENTRGRDLNVVIKKNHLKVQLKSQDTAIVDAQLTKTIICDDSFWTVEDGNRLVINLQKLHQMEWWNAVCIGDPTIDVTKVQPENSKLDELDGETRQTVEKMMFDQRQKALGLPSSDEQRKFDALEKFKQAHPEMDFSNAKMS